MDLEEETGMAEVRGEIAELSGENHLEVYSRCSRGFRRTRQHEWRSDRTVCDSCLSEWAGRKDVWESDRQPHGIYQLHSQSFIGEYDFLFGMSLNNSAQGMTATDQPIREMRLGSLMTMMCGCWTKYHRVNEYLIPHPITRSQVIPSHRMDCGQSFM
jgi:hypothetical protein